jgi:glucose-1-phosphate thymidylyltransferase
MVACVEEVAYKMGFMGAAQVREAADKMKGNAYGQYLASMLEEESGVDGR